MNEKYSGLAAIPVVFPLVFAVAAIVGLGAVVFCVTDSTQESDEYDTPSQMIEAAASVTATVRKKDTVQHRRFYRQSGKSDFVPYYYVTFEAEDGEMIALRVFEEDFSRMAEGDRGKLRFRGGRFLGFYKL